MPPPLTVVPTRSPSGWARAVLGTIGLGLVVAGLMGCGPGRSDAEDAGTPRAYDLSVSLSSGHEAGSQVDGADLDVTGTGDPEASLLTENGGVVRAATDPDTGPALRYPAYVASEEAPTAIFSVTSADPGWLQPGRESFSFGVDVALDTRSSGTHHDNGDNLVQRGLFVDPTQFKLQADHHHPSCLVRGDEGMVLVVSPETLEPDRWYRLICAREGDEVSVTVARLENGKPVDPRTTTDSGEIGSVTFPVDTPVSIGGKLGPDHLPAAATDQLNGTLARVFVTTDPG